MLFAADAGTPPAPPNLEELECALHQRAFEFGVQQVASNAQSIHDALNLDSCAANGFLDARTRAANRAAIAASLPSPTAAAAPHADGAIIVATDGDDATGDGSLERPFASLARARDALRSQSVGAGQQQAKSKSIALRAGKYFLNETLQLTARDSGLSIGPYNGESVTLSGGLRIGSALQWTPATGMPGVFVADVTLPRSARSNGGGGCGGGCGGDDCGLEEGTDFSHNDLLTTTAENATDCCNKCKAHAGCKAFTIEHESGGRCWLKSSDAGRQPYADHVSGRPGLAPPPTPPPTPAPTPDFGPAPSAVNSLFVNGTRMVRARYPNGNPQDNSGLCFSKVQRQDGTEGCSGYVQARGSAGTQNGGTTVYKVSSGLNRGDSPTLGCGKQCEDYGSFQYTIYDPPAGHPVYDRPLPGWGWGNNSVFSFWGSPFARPGGLEFDRGTWTNKTWANPRTAVVHMFHSGLWGGWQFQVSGLDASKSQLLFGYGGYQEARGSGVNSNHFYVENVLEELDAPSEWFYDEGAGKLYFKPNVTDSAEAPAALASAEVVLPLLDSLVVVNGSAAAGGVVTGVSLDGLALTETRSTFLQQYEVPSGGDWSLHRGGAVHVEDAEAVSVTRCLFDQVGGNGVLLSRHVARANVSHNEFVASGDSAVVSAGVADGIDGTAPTYPTGNTVSHNHVHDYGVYGKQTSCYFQALTANATVQGNVCYNGPRAHVNFNDGFGGGTRLASNLLFNAVRETGDHGPFNSWDRQPFLTRNGVDDGFPDTEKHGTTGASIVKAQCHLENNFILNGYNSVWTIDHDDGSQFYNDTANVLVWGGCKNYRGNSKSCDHNLILYPGIGERSSGGRRCQTDDNGIFANQFFHNNTCLTQDGDFYSFGHCSDKSVDSEAYHTEFNTFLAPGALFASGCGSTKDLKDWQKLGQDHGSTAADAPSVDAIVKMVGEKLAA